MRIEETLFENQLQLEIEGRVDTATAPQLQTAILKAFQKYAHIVLNFEKVEYVSSAGLRALLIGQKTASSKGGKMVLVHVPPAVMQVLKLSNFASILNIE